MENGEWKMDEAASPSSICSSWLLLFGRLRVRVSASRRSARGGRLRTREALLVRQHFRHVGLDPLVVEKLTHQNPSIRRVPHLLFQGVGSLLSDVLILAHEGLFAGI